MPKNFEEKIQGVYKRFGTDVPLERYLGSGLNQPFNNLNSSPRKIMYHVHGLHKLNLLNAEKAILETGYEIRYGDLSSTVVATDSDYRVIAKISKFDFSPNHHYYLILEDTKNRKLDVIERISYKHITESYGYLYNNEYMDNLHVGQIIPTGQIVKKSLAFDEYMNRRDGCNMNVAYMSLDKNMEDSVIISDVAAKRFTAPLVKPVEIMINENDIPLNLYGTDNMYKCIPDIGEDIKDAILIALRKEKKEESLYAQSVESLKHTMMSDDKFTLTGKVVDVNIYCNNPENLNSYYNSQFKMYYDQMIRMNTQIIQTVTQYIARSDNEKYELSYDLQKLYGIAKRVINGDQYMEKRQFSNIIIQIVVLEERGLQAGDKVSNRYGGKGVASTIMPQKLMPRFGDNEYVDIILNSNGVYGRENIGQLFELSVTHIGCELVHRIASGEYTIDESLDLILKYINFVSQEQAQSLRITLSDMNMEEKRFFLESVVMDGAIHLSAKPITESFSIDKLAEMYKAFPWVKQTEIEVPIKDSNGNIRYVKARRPIVVGKQYTFRLKQYAEEKFSATSLSATNIKNENTKSKASRQFRELYSNTPIRFGNMESNDLNHLGAGYVVVNLLIHSLSPHARRLTEQMFTANPFHIDIKLDSESSNRSAEITNTYLKTIGRRLIFNKHKKVRKKIVAAPFYSNKPLSKPALFINKEDNFDWEKDWEERQKLAEAKANAKDIKPAFDRFDLIDTKRREKQWTEERDQSYRDWKKSVIKKKQKELDKIYNK